MRLGVSIVAALACFVRVASAQVALEIVQNTSTQVWVVSHGSAQQVTVPSGTSPESWSIDGRWLVLSQPKGSATYQLSLLAMDSAFRGVMSLQGLCSPPSWAPDGRRFAFEVEGKGLHICDVSGSEPLVHEFRSVGHSPSWSPNGGRIAHCGRKPEQGIWIVSEDGHKSQRINATLDAESLSWSPDGRNLAVVSQAKSSSKELWVIAATGKSSKSFGSIDSKYVKWSANGEELLCLRGRSWGTISVKSGEWTSYPLDAQSQPSWEGSKSVVGVESGKAVRVLGKTSTAYFSETPKGLPEGRVVSIAACPGLVLEGPVSSPFAKLPQPAQGQIRVLGIVEDIDFDEGLVAVNIWSVLTPDGMELVLSKPIRQSVRLTSFSKRATEQKQVPLTEMDFVQQGEVALILEGKRAGVPEVLPVTFGVIPELAVEAQPNFKAVVRTGIRALDYDGVSMEAVTIPLTFPVIGKVNWSDSFLASRGGGSRRHHGQDLMAAKMCPLVAAFDGVVKFNTSKAKHNTITLKGDNGWTAVYMHVNNDTPGTDDAKGGTRYAFAMGLKSGDRVTTGQFLGFCGDSGNAESTGPHCHFELHEDQTGGVFNATPSLSEAEKLDRPVPIDPCPGLRPKPGEARWDIVVTLVDRERNVIVGDLISLDEGNGLIASTFPRRVYVKCPPGVAFSLRSSKGEARTFLDVKEGGFISAMGSKPESDQAMTATSVGVGQNLRQ